MPEEKVSYVCATCNEPHGNNLGYDHRFRPKPAVDAGPRQPEPRPKNWKMASRSDYQKCEVCGTRWFANEKLPCPRCSNVTAREEKDDLLEKAPETLPNGNFVWCCKGTDGHEEHCVYHSPFQLQAAPVPQEAAPRECDCEECASRLATAPDSAMRVGLAERKIRERFGKHGDLARIDDILAALIREPLEQSQKFAAQLESNIKFLNERIEAGSERERELRACLGQMVERGIILNLTENMWQCLYCYALGKRAGSIQHKETCDWAEASRLLGGESK